MQQLIERFLTAKRAENSAPNTIRGYRQDLRDLHEFVGSSAKPQDFSKHVVRAYLVMMNKRGATKTSIMRRLHAIKSFVRWMLSEEMITDDFAMSIYGLEGAEVARAPAASAKSARNGDAARRRFPDRLP